MKRFLALLVLLAAGCAQTPALANSNAGGSTGTLATRAKGIATSTTRDVGGTASVNLVWPCPVLGGWLPDALKANLNVLVDGKPVSTLHNCQHTRVAVAAGKRGIRLGDPYVDFGAMFGTGDTFELPPGEQLFLIASPDGHGNVFVNEVSRTRASAEIAAIDTH